MKASEVQFKVTCEEGREREDELLVDLVVMLQDPKPKISRCRRCSRGTSRKRKRQTHVNKLTHGLEDVGSVRGSLQLMSMPT